MTSPSSSRRVAHICPLLANVGNANAGSEGFAHV